MNLILDWNVARQLELDREDLAESLSQANWWTECAGVFRLEPRQIGKSSELRDLAEHIYSIDSEALTFHVVPFATMLKTEDNIFDVNVHEKSLDEGLKGRDPSYYDLLVDEFMYLSKEAMKKLLDRPWKSVTMIGSYKI